MFLSFSCNECIDEGSHCSCVTLTFPLRYLANAFAGYRFVAFLAVIKRLPSTNSSPTIPPMAFQNPLSLD